MLDFLKIRKGVDELAAELAKFDDDIETAKRRREFLLEAPLPREEFADRVCTALDGQAVDYPERLQLALSNLVRRPFHDFRGSSLNLVAPHGGATGSLPQASAAFLFGDILKAKIREAIMAMPYPEAEAGPPLEDRQAEIERLEKKIERLEAQRADLQRQAEQAGIRI